MLFGAGRELDAFIAAFRIPNLFRDLFAEGALSAAFVTTFTRTADRHGERAAWDLACRVLNDLAIVVGVLSVTGMIFAPAIVDLVAPGFAAVPGKTELTVLLTRILFPFLLFVALAAVAMGILNTRGVFGVPASASMFFNLGSVVIGLAGAFLLAPDYLLAVFAGLAGVARPLPETEAERALLGMAIGTLAGGSLQFLVQTPALGRVGFRYRPLVSFRDPRVLEVLRLMGPATIGVAAVQVNVVVNTIFASTLGDGPVSWLGVAFRLIFLPIGMFGVALGTATLPAVARAASAHRMDDFRRHLTEALRLLVVLCLPAAVGLIVASEPVIGLIYEHGRFGPNDTAQAAVALSAYAVGLTGYAAIKILGPAFYALGLAAIPMRVSLLSVATNLTLNWIAVRNLGFGHGGLALSTSLVAISNAAILFVALRRRTGPLGAGLTTLVGKSVAASAGMALACWLWLGWLGPNTAGLAGSLLRVGTAIPLGIGVYAGAGLALGIPEVKRLARAGGLRSQRSSRAQDGPP